MSLTAVKRRMMGDLALDPAGSAVQSQTDTDDLTDEVFTVYKAAADGAASDVSSLLAFKAPYPLRIVGLTIIPNTTLTGHDTTNAVFTLGKADGIGGASTVMATLTTNVAGGNWAADVFEEATLSTVAGATSVARGQVVTLKITKGSTGVVVPASSYNIRVRRI